LRKGRIAVALLLSVLALVIVLTLSNGPGRKSVTAPSPSSPSPSVSLSPAPSVPETSPPEPTESPPSLPEGVTLALPLQGWVTGVAAGPDAVYVVYVPDPLLPDEVIARLDVGTGSVVRSEVLGPFVDVAIVGDNLWAEAGEAPSRSLVHLDAETLTILGRTDLPGAFARAMAPSPAGLWVGGRGHLYLLDPSDGHVLVTVKVAGSVVALAVDVAGRFMYVSAEALDESGPLPVGERDGATGALLLTVPGPDALSIGGLSATSGGVWTSYATGMLGAVVFLRAADLREVAVFGPWGDRVAGTNDVSANVAAGMLWVGDGMTGELSCADAATGKVLGMPLPQFIGVMGLRDVVGLGAFVYVGSSEGLLRIDPDISCRSS
jgi:hypothetical protein